MADIDALHIATAASVQALAAALQQHSLQAGLQTKVGFNTLRLSSL
jgi:hypothetical protein